LREKCPRKKKTPNSCPVNGAVTGKLLTNNNNSKPFTECFPQWIGQDRSICTLYITMEDSNGLHSRY
jgi:hypothetical protein